MIGSKIVVMFGLAAMAAACGNESDPKNNELDAAADTQVADMPDNTSDAQTPDLGPPDMGTEPGDMAPDMTAGDAGQDMGADMGGPCSRNGFALAQENVDFDSANNFFIYSGLNMVPGAGITYDKFSFELYPDFGATIGQQDYTFPGQNYADCGTCLLIFADCTMGVGCDKTFLVDSGSVSVSTAGTTAGDPFAATFTDLVLSEVTLDANFMSTKVVGGETYCIPSLTASGTTVVF